MTNRTRAALVGLAVIVAVAAFLISRSSDNNAKRTAGSTVHAGATTSTGTTGAAAPRPAAPAIPVVRIQSGQPVGGVKEIKVSKGGRVRFEVVSDSAGEIHVHGYDRHEDVKPGRPVRFDFPASIDGVFVVELESSSRQVASLVVEP